VRSFPPTAFSFSYYSVRLYLQIWFSNRRAKSRREQKLDCSCGPDVISIINRSSSNFSADNSVAASPVYCFAHTYAIFCQLRPVSITAARCVACRAIVSDS